jgi:hypothetical protein
MDRTPVPRVSKPSSARTRHHEREGRDERLALLLLVTTKLEVLAALESHLHLVLADGALEPEDDLLGRLGLLVEDGLGLTTVSCLHTPPFSVSRAAPSRPVM